MLTKLEIQLYSIVHTLALTQRAQTQDKCNACIMQKFLFYVLFEIVG
jgi:hypothetical protein